MLPIIWHSGKGVNCRANKISEAFFSCFRIVLLFCARYVNALQFTYFDAQNHSIGFFCCPRAYTVNVPLVCIYRNVDIARTEVTPIWLWWVSDSAYWTQILQGPSWAGLRFGTCVFVGRCLLSFSSGRAKWSALMGRRILHITVATFSPANFTVRHISTVRKSRTWSQASFGWCSGRFCQIKSALCTEPSPGVLRLSLLEK